MLAGSNSDTVKTLLRVLSNFRNGRPPFTISLKASCHSSVTLSHAVESIMNGSVG